jgi:hypothetical protein
MNARRLLAAGVVAVALATAAAGCGDDVGASNAYVDRVNVAQTQLAANFSRLSREISDTTTPAQARKTLRSIDAAITANVTDLRGITPPDKVKKQHADLVEAIATYGEAVGQAESNLSGTTAQATLAETRLAADTKHTSTAVTLAISAINDKLHN